MPLLPHLNRRLVKPYTSDMRVQIRSQPRDELCVAAGVGDEDFFGHGNTSLKHHVSIIFSISSFASASRRLASWRAASAFSTVLRIFSPSSFIRFSSKIGTLICVRLPSPKNGLICPVAICSIRAFPTGEFRKPAIYQG